MKPASTTRSGSYDATVAVSAASQSRGRVVLDPVHEGRDARALRARQPLDVVAVGADGDHAAPYAGSRHASSRAWRLVPAPETSTTRRAGAAGTGRSLDDQVDRGVGSVDRLRAIDTEGDP